MDPSQLRETPMGSEYSPISSINYDLEEDQGAATLELMDMLLAKKTSGRSQKLVTNQWRPSGFSCLII